MSDTTLIVRVDATETIGIGHLMRCLTLACEWRKRMGPVIFVSSCSSELMIEKIKAEGITIVETDMDRPFIDDLEEIRSVISKTNARWLVLDGYHFGREYHESITSLECRLLVMDDYHHLPDYHVDILVNPNINASQINYNCAPGTIKLTGSEYVLLRNEFLKSPRKRQTTEKVQNILITMGGADPDNLSEFILKSLNHIDRSKLNIRVLIGPGFEFLEKLKKTANDNRFAVELIVNPKSVSQQMLWADMAISSAGSTCWELAYLGLPSLLIVAAENQRMNAQAFAGEKAFLNLGSYRDQTEKTLAVTIEKFMDDVPTRELMFKRQQKLVDGRGAERIIEEMSRFED